MRFAIIDLGTNSVRFDVHEFGPDDTLYRLHREKLMIRLGEGVFLKGRLNPRSADLCVEAFKSFARTILEFRVPRVIAFGTSALREARDADRLIKRIRKESGIQIKIISGEEEARLIAKGILLNERTQRGAFGLIDIGGGSTEVSVCQGGKVLHSSSFPLGTARLQQVYLKTIPPLHTKDPKDNPVNQLRKHIRAVLLFKIVAESWRKTKVILGSSGTVRALSKISKKLEGTDIITFDFLSELVEKMTKMNRKQLIRIPGMENRRIDMLLSGAILLQECMNALHAEEVHPTEFSLRDGILEEEFESFSQDRVAHNYDALVDLFKTAQGMGLPTKELKQAQKIAEDLFRLSRSLHKLDQKYQLYLVAAALLVNTGKVISPIDSEAHSEYIARFADIPVFEAWESKLIAELCFHQQNGKIELKDIPFKKDRKLKRIFFRLLALLRLSAALSYQRSTPISFGRLIIEKNLVRLQVTRRSKAALPLLRAEYRKSMFEEVFHKQFVFEQV